MIRKPTLLDVAAAAGVSKSLVSLAVRGEGRVGDDTRRRILEAADRLGYRSNPWARSLARGRSQTIGVLVGDLRGYHVDVVRGFEDAAATAGSTVFFADGRRDPVVLATRLESMLSLGIDGVVVVSGLADAEVLRAAVGRLPLVVVGRPRAVPEQVSQVCNDDRVGARMAVHHLAALGHRRIAHIAGSTREAALARRSSYEETMAALGVGSAVRVYDDPAALVVDVAGGSRDAPTAVFCATDNAAIATVGAAVDAGVDVPARLSVVGYDNIEAASSLRPALTTVDQPRRRMGELAMVELTNLMAGGAARRSVVAPSLVVRRSTSAPLA